MPNPVVLPALTMKLFYKGFSLLELMVAIVILVIGIGSLLFALVNCILLNETNRNLVIAANDAQYVLEQIKGYEYSNISNYSYSGPFNLENETVDVDPDPGNGITNITVNVSWTERGRPRNFQLSTRIADTSGE